MKLPTFVLFLAMFAINPTAAPAESSPNGVEETNDSDSYWNSLQLAAESQQQKQNESAGEKTEEEPDCE